MVFRTLLFLLINFGALGLGGLFTGKGVPGEWYANLNKAPWTPPGWVFGFAWTTIMICFAFYMAYLWQESVDKKIVLGLFCLQWILNVVWNPTFFYYNNIGLALMVIVALSLVVGFLLLNYQSQLQSKSVLIAPYLVWLIIATSLNAYAYLYN